MVDHLELPFCQSNYSNGENHILWLSISKNGKCNPNPKIVPRGNFQSSSDQIPKRTNISRNQYKHNSFIKKCNQTIWCKRNKQTNCAIKCIKTTITKKQIQVIQLYDST